LGDRLTPTNTLVNGFSINKSVNGVVGILAKNTDINGNGAYSSVSVGGDGNNYENSASLNFYGKNYYIPELRNTGGIYSTNPFKLVNLNNSSIDFLIGDAFGTQTSKLAISSGGTITIGTQPQLDNTSTRLLARNNSGNIVEVSLSGLSTSSNLQTTLDNGSIATIQSASDPNDYFDIRLPENDGVSNFFGTISCLDNDNQNSLNLDKYSIEIKKNIYGPDTDLNLTNRIGWSNNSVISGEYNNIISSTLYSISGSNSGDYGVYMPIPYKTDNPIEVTSVAILFPYMTGSTVETIATQEFVSNKYIPYSGATQDVDLGEYQLKSNQIEFNQNPTGTFGVGKMRWNDTDGTAEIMLKGGDVTLQVGQETVVRVVNKSGSLIPNGKVVKVVANPGGSNTAISLAQANSDANSTTVLGITTEDIGNNNLGFITIQGLVHDVNTNAFNEGDVLYLSPTIAGDITNVKPVAPQHMVIVGYVAKKGITDGHILMHVQNGYELDELHNVKISGATNNQSLVYNSTTDLWENKSLITQTILSGNTGTTSSERAVFNALNLKANTSDVVLLTGNQTIAGVKTFTSEIIVNNGIRVGLGNANGTNLVVGNAFSSGINASSTGNIAIGSNALSSIGGSTAVSNNIAIGSLAMQVGSQMTNNVAIGTGALRRIQFSTNSNNVAVGFSSGELTNSGGLANAVNQCTLIGSQTTTLNNNDVNSIVIGFQGRGNGSNTVTLGNTSIVDTFLRGRVNIQQYTTATRPVYSKGAIIFDSTLNKLVIGGATAWEVISST
jgi:hypothetical protein